MRDGCTVRLEASITRHQDVGAAGQGLLWQALPRLAPHDARLSHRDRLEVAHVSRNSPRDLALMADGAIAGAREHKDNRRTHCAARRSSASLSTRKAVHSFMGFAPSAL